MKGPSVAVYPSGNGASSGGPPSREVQELWFALARSPWTSVVVVPADEGASAAEIATSLAEVGRRLRETPVTAIVADSLDYDTARALADLEQHVDRQRQRALDVNASVVETPVGDESAPANVNRSGQLVVASVAQVIVAVQSVVEQPLGIAIAQAADAVVLCIEMGRTRFSAARRTIELIGRERIAGCYLVHGARP